jgi:hypothetical protein
MEVVTVQTEAVTRTEARMEAVTRTEADGGGDGADGDGWRW